MSESPTSVRQVIIGQSERVLETYRIDPGLIQEHANGERRITQGGYGDRQIFELVQNGADELRSDPGGRISVVLTSTHLYCANQGTPMTTDGADTILRMSVSRKRGGQIGRFGVGVKSVLSVTDAPQFFSSRTDSFGFDKAWAEGRIRAVQPNATDVPVLRMAQLLDRDQEVAADPLLGDLLSWATTVVRLPLKLSQVSRLATDLDAFPARFLLFSGHVGEIILENRIQSTVRSRSISQKIEGASRILIVNAAGKKIEEKWRVFTATFNPSNAALVDAGELHDRPEIDVSWAVPDETGRARQLGEFWAYFPTNYKTTLRGIVNAPWKTSEDRQNLFDHNAFNKELIEVAARLVVDSMESLSLAVDPCLHLDHAPARGREEPQWAAEQLVRSIWKIAAEQRSLPDQKGRFVAPRDLYLHPDGLRPEWREWWAAYTGRPVNWCHHSVERTKHRREGAERIFAAAKRSTASVREWLEALVADESPEASARAVLIAADMKRWSHGAAEEAVRARIILTEAHGLVAPSHNVFRRTTTDSLGDRLVYVDDRVLSETAVVQALEQLGVHEADAAGRFSAVVDQGFHGYGDKQWDAFWALSRQAGPAAALAALRGRRSDGKILDTASAIKVRTVSGEFRPIRSCLLPGRVVPADGSRDTRIAVDMNFHSPDRPILRDLGLLDGPIAGTDPRDEHWYHEYTESRWKLYCKRLPAASHRPQLTTMRFDGASPAGPLHFLTELSNEGKAAFLAALPPHGLVTTWTMQAGKQQGTREAVMSPLVWMARTHGALRTSRGVRPVVRSVSPLLEAHGEVLPVAQVSTNIAEALKLPATLSTVPPRIWQELVAEVSRSESDTFPGLVYALLFEAEAAWPEEATTRCRVGDEWRSDLPDGEIAVTGSRPEYDELVRERVPALLAPTEEAADQIRETWGMLAPQDVIQREIRSVPEMDPVPVTDEFPHLKINFRSKVDGWSLVRCSELEEITRTPRGIRPAPVDVAVADHQILVLRPADEMALISAVDRALKLGLGPSGCRAILERRKQQRDNERLQRARKAKDAAEKVLELVGDAETLKKGLPRGLVESEEAESGREPNALRIAQLAVDAYGSGVLRQFRKEIAANVPEVSARFTGDFKSLQLVNQIQLDESFAGTRAHTPDPVEVVSGPTAFPRLHDYQERLTANMFDLLTRYKAPKAMMCLPTGAGKTRVASEAVIRVIKEQGLNGRPVLWIAQGKELCEQAVQSWRFVWSKVGPEEPLTISRLWGSNEAAAVRGTAHLVVATDAKLEEILDTQEYEWLRDPAMVLVDEAHTSITPRYTKLLRLLGITHKQAGRPLIGLTATPFRGFNVDETKRLVDRYGKLRLDEGIFDGDPYLELQELGVLARVEHREFKGATLDLTPEELEGMGFGGRLPTSAEQRLSEDGDRNDTLLREILELPDDGPVLLFATSVNHARLLAAMLNGRGVKAAAIDATTPPSERLTTVEAFRSGKIRVLTNYGVLAQGFDAPATRTVVVARPTYSPNVYQQMIGRGLRGPRNGGKEMCRILDVHDNITNYDKKLAFTEFDYLWGRK